MTVSVITASQHEGPAQWYLKSLRGDFEVFRPAGATGCIDLWSTPPCQFSLPSVQGWGCGAPKTVKILPDFFKISEYKRP